MQRVLLFIVMVGGLLTIDWIASEGRYSREAWRDVEEQGRYVRHRVEYWVGRFGR